MRQRAHTLKPNVGKSGTTYAGYPTVEDSLDSANRRLLCAG